jgi:hypothetical protein
MDNFAEVQNPEPEDDGIICDCPPPVMLIDCQGGITIPPRRTQIGE